MFGKGISREGDLIDAGVTFGVVDKSGSWLSCGELRLGQGRENAKKYLADNPDLREEIKTKVLVAKGLVEAPAPSEEVKA